ncbi:alpha/beta fold hydrolase [Frondihabitans cladoniiphilus]|uniref:AB hydrolase-1 domain-containing protein n=1 Tax=Frondihabitans cladoniiphilus TaxID=715785 RepID=A0ABP8W7J6_9MICO
MRRLYVDLPDGQVHVRTAGHGPIPIVLLHQTAASSVMYEAFSDEFFRDRSADDFTLFAIDTPGFGMSYQPVEAYSLESWADVVALVATELGLDGFHVLGHHTGAAVAILVASRHPERVLGLTMIGALVLPPAEAAERHAAVRGLVPVADGSHLLDVWEAVNTIDGDPLAYPPSLELREREAVDKLLAGTRWHEAYLAVFSADLAAPLASVGCPILLICGRADVLRPYVPTTLAANPRAKCVELASGAYVLDQDPALVVGPFAAFLDAVPAAERVAS